MDNHLIDSRAASRGEGLKGGPSSTGNQVGGDKCTTGSKIKLQKCKRPTKVSTSNVRTLNEQSRKGELTPLSEK